MEKLGTNKLNMQKLLAPAALVILYIVFSIFGNNFLSLDMVKNILESSYYIGFMAFGVTFVIITGGIDLSLGTAMMCAALLGGFSFKQGCPLILSVLLTILVGVVFGFVNGIFVAKLKLPPFIATLGTQMMASGIGSIITKVQSQTWPTATAEVGSWFKKVFIRSEVFGIKGFPVGAFWLIGFFLIAAAILHRRLIFHLLFRQVGRDNSRQLCAAASVNDCKNLFGCIACLTFDTEIIDHNELVISEAVKKPLSVIAVLQQIQETWKAGDRGRNVLL